MNEVQMANALIKEINHNGGTVQVQLYKDRYSVLWGDESEETAFVEIGKELPAMRMLYHKFMAHVAKINAKD